MVRIDNTAILLILANLIAFMAFGLIGFGGDILVVEKECQELERKLPQLKERFEWVNNAKGCISNPPEANSGQLARSLDADGIKNRA